LVGARGHEPARRGGGGHGGGGHGGGFHSGGGGFHSGGGGFHHGGGFYGGYGYGPGIYFGGYPYYGGYSDYYDSPIIGSYPVSPSESYYEGSGVVPQYSEVQPAPSTASMVGTGIRVILPSANATVWLDGQQIPGSTDTHIMEFGNETAGKMYQHTIKAAWNRDGKPVTEERTVKLAGGTSAVVDFNRPVK
jgi:uncharacterized protein (TIGR03000 family)